MRKDIERLTPLIVLSWLFVYGATRLAEDDSLMWLFWSMLSVSWILDICILWIILIKPIIKRIPAWYTAFETFQKEVREEQRQIEIPTWERPGNTYKEN